MRYSVHLSHSRDTAVKAVVKKKAPPSCEGLARDPFLEQGRTGPMLERNGQRFFECHS